MGNKLLYHYTNLSACSSILNNKSIWLSDCRFLNDTKELKEAIDIFLEPFSDEDRKILSSSFIYNSFNRNYCIFSLSKKHNVLSQWRAYSNDAKGVAIGFDRNVLEKLGFTCVDCIYEEHKVFLEDVREKHSNAIERILHSKKELVAENDFIRWLGENNSIVDNVVNDLLKVKNIAFKEEQEVRIIKSFSSEEMLFRESNDKVVPYKEMIFWNESSFDMAIVIPEIWLGPKCNSLNAVSLRMLSRLTEFKAYDCGYV